MKLLIENWKRYLEEEASPATQGQKNMTLVVPKFRISEQWGTPGSQDRKIIELFTSKIKGSTLKEKISSLNGFVFM